MARELLLDTHIVLWQLSGERSLGLQARTAILESDALYVSVVSFAELGVKAAMGKIAVPDDFVDRVLETGLKLLALAPEHGLGVSALPLHHRDPFDRLLIAQANAEGLALVTGDERITRYEVDCVLAYG